MASAASALLLRRGTERAAFNEGLFKLPEEACMQLRRGMIPYGKACQAASRGVIKPQQATSFHFTVVQIVLRARPDTFL